MKKEKENYGGNVFNANKDNNGRGIKIDDLISLLEASTDKEKTTIVSS